MTTIEWTNETWNPIAAFNTETGKRGWFCTKPSQGCKNCYAENRNRHIGNGLLYTVGNAGRVRQELVNLDRPFHWRRPRMVFPCSMTDLFLAAHTTEMIAQVFAVMALTGWHTYQVLTKRADRMRDLLQSYAFRTFVRDFAEQRSHAPAKYAWPLPNVWLGVTAENQETAEERIPSLLRTPAAMRWISAEPLLGPLNLSPYLDQVGYLGNEYVRPLDWVVVGGESGPKSREFDLAWAKSIIAQCAENGTACFVKQLGRRPVAANDWHSDEWPGGSMPIDEKHEVHHQGEIAPLTLIDAKGGDLNEWPESLRVREWPRAIEATP